MMIRFILYLSLFALLVGCGEPLSGSFRAVGFHDNQKYKIDVNIGGIVSAPTLAIFLNDEQALYVERPMSMMSDANCEKLLAYGWKCRFSDTYKGLQVAVVEEINASPYFNYRNYDVYLDGQLLQRVIGTF